MFELIQGQSHHQLKMKIKVITKLDPKNRLKFPNSVKQNQLINQDKSQCKKFQLKEIT